MLRFCLTLALFLAGLAPTPAPAATPTSPATPASVSIAAAANLVYALDALNAAFKQSTPDDTLTCTTGASGNLVAQITNGAPYDIFLSADLDYPQALIKAGHADAKTITTFAIGRLVLWTTKPGVEVTDIIATVNNPAVQKLAVANPVTAPYGRAALQVIDHLGLTSAARLKIVTGENITQTAQFVETGHADAGFVARSLVLSPKLRDKGRWIEISAALHAPLDQGVVITQRGAANPAAARYLAFLKSDPARKIFERYGYALPAK
jgi:molybdate transport system substrate-binding protein